MTDRSPSSRLPAEFVDYVAGLPPERAEVVAAVIEIISDALPDGYAPTMDYGMPHFVVPLADYPDTDNGHPLPVVGLAAQKNHFSLYLHGVYASDAELERFRADWAASGKKLDMGKSCVRFRAFDDLVPDAVAGTISRTTPAELIAQHERSRSTG